MSGRHLGAVAGVAVAIATAAVITLLVQKGDPADAPTRPEPVRPAVAPEIPKTLPAPEPSKVTPKAEAEVAKVKRPPAKVPFLTKNRKVLDRIVDRDLSQAIDNLVNAKKPAPKKKVLSPMPARDIVQPIKIEKQIEPDEDGDEGGGGVVGGMVGGVVGGVGGQVGGVVDGPKTP